jgi:hypothetical protein
VPHASLSRLDPPVAAALDGAVRRAAPADDSGTPIEEFERLARQFNLVAGIQEVTVADLQRLLAAGKWPIAYLDRAMFDLKPRRRARYPLGEAKIHTVIPSRGTAAAVTFHDPLPPRITRKSMHLFRLAYEPLGSRCVVCSKQETT